MDFKESVLCEFESLPSFWWVWMVMAGTVTVLICLELKVSARKTVRCSLLVAYVLFILYETVIGRKKIAFRVELVPFWSYAHPDLYCEIILNYVLFIPLGILLYEDTEISDLLCFLIN